MNHVVLFGHLTSAPQVRELPSGSTLWSLEVSTPSDDGTMWSVPVAWFDPPKPLTFGVGDEVVVVGGVRRRFYRSGHGTQSRTEVVAATVVARKARSWRTPVRRVSERLGVASTGEVPSA